MFMSSVVLQICKSIKGEIRRDGASVIVKLDMKRINSLRLCINAHMVGDIILDSLKKGQKQSGEKTVLFYNVNLFFIFLWASNVK